MIRRVWTEFWQLLVGIGNSGDVELHGGARNPGDIVVSIFVEGEMKHMTDADVDHVAKAFGRIILPLGLSVVGQTVVESRDDRNRNVVLLGIVASDAALRDEAYRCRLTKVSGSDTGYTPLALTPSRVKRGVFPGSSGPSFFTASERARLVTRRLEMQEGGGPPAVRELLRASGHHGSVNGGEGVLVSLRGVGILDCVLWPPPPGAREWLRGPSACRALLRGAAGTSGPVYSQLSSIVGPRPALLLVLASRMMLWLVIPAVVGLFVLVWESLSHDLAVEALKSLGTEAWRWTEEARNIANLTGIPTPPNTARTTLEQTVHSWDTLPIGATHWLAILAAFILPIVGAVLVRLWQRTAAEAGDDLSDNEDGPEQSQQEDEEEIRSNYVPRGPCGSWSKQGHISIPQSDIQGTRVLVYFEVDYFEADYFEADY